MEIKYNKVKQKKMKFNRGLCMSENEIFEYIGNLDRKKLGKYRNRIITEDVILTAERIRHIKQHHPGDYENYGIYIKQIIKEPDYILEDKKNIDTVIYMKNILEEDKIKY